MRCECFVCFTCGRVVLRCWRVRERHSARVFDRMLRGRGAGPSPLELGYNCSSPVVPLPVSVFGGRSLFGASRLTTPERLGVCD